MKNIYINKVLAKALTGALLITSLGSCTVYSQGQQYPNTTYNNQQSTYNNDVYDNSYDDSNEPDVSFDNFYSALSPYGSWTNYGNYGQVWVCSDPSFRPYYSNGSWVNTNMGWNWNSGYSWGWAPFHYGRWGFDPEMGWYWVPGYQWAPAWVYWGNASNNYAWAPVAPGMGIGINISVGSIPVNFWTYLPGQYMGYSNINRYYIPRERNNVYIRNTTIINNYTVINRNNNMRYAAGPRVDDVQRFTGRPVNTVRVIPSNNVSNNGRINNGTMTVYRPGRNGGNRGAQGNNNSKDYGGFSKGGNSNTQGVGGTGRNNPTNNSGNNGVGNNNSVSTWNRGDTRNSSGRNNNNNQNPIKISQQTPTTGSNSSNNNNARPSNQNGSYSRWGSWNRGASNSGNTANQPSVNRNTVQGVGQNANTQTNNSSIRPINRGNFSQQNTQQRSVNSVGSNINHSNTQNQTHSRPQNFNGGKFSRGDGRR